MITLERLCGKEVTLTIYERLNKAIERAYLNILDDDTNPEEKRTVTLKITMKAGDENVFISADVQTKVAGEKSIGAFFPKQRGQAYIDVYGNYHSADPETGEIMEVEDE